MIQNSGVAPESIKAIQRDWTAAEQKSKIAAKTLKRKEFDALPHTQRAAFVKSGGKVV